MAIVAPTLKYADPTKVVGGDLSSSFQKMMALSNPLIQQANAQTDQRLADASQLRSFTPSDIQRIMGSNNSVVASTGLNDPTDILGMTADEYHALLAPKESPTQILQRNMALVDQVTGMPEHRKNMADSINRQHAANVQNIDTSARFGGSSQNQLDSATNHALATDASGRMNVDTTNANLQTRAAEANQNDARQREQLAEQRRSNRAMESHRAQQLALESTRTRYVQSLAKAAQGGATVPGTSNDDAFAGQLTRQLEQFGAIDPKDPQGSLNLGNVDDKLKPQAFQAYMQREAAKGLPYYETFYNMAPGTEKYIGGYKKIVLGPGGWHGVYAKGGKEHATDRPVIPYRSSPTKQDLSASTTSGQTQNVYQ